MGSSLKTKSTGKAPKCGQQQEAGMRVDGNSERSTARAKCIMQIKVAILDNGAKTNVKVKES